jgi:Uma2 family endonuclease
MEIETLGKQELLVNPQLLIEILSDSTADFDRGDKFTYYKSIESFTEYILVAQHRPNVTQFIKQSDNSWLQHEFNDLSDTFQMATLDSEIALTEIYQNVEFPERSTRFDLIPPINNE